MTSIRALLVATAVAQAAWCALVGVMAWRNRPRTPEAGPATTELPAEPVAVVNLLTEGFRSTAEAAPAVLLDLCVRGHLTIDLVGAGHEVIRLRDKSLEGLRRYERQVLDHLRSLERAGVVPARAIQTGPKDRSRRWWLAFRGDVIGHAQTLGYCRDRWSRRDVAVLWGAGLLTVVLYAAALRFDSANITTSLGGFGLVWSSAGIVLALLALTASMHQRDTDLGLAAASRWTGVRAALASNEVLRSVPPSSVAVYGSHLAYATAMGLAPSVAAGLPLGAEDDRQAWSSVTGRWRQVRVSYPFLRPSWGRMPAIALARGSFAAVVGGLATFGIPWFAPGVEPGWFARLFRSTVLIASVGGLAWGGIVALMAAADLWSRRTVEGVVLRLRDRGRFKWHKHQPEKKWFVAVDDGTSDRVVALSVPERIYDRLSQGEHVRVEVSRFLGHVSSVEPSMPRAREPG